MLRLLMVAVSTLAFASASCVSPPPPAERASDAARKLNVGARLGDMASVLDLTSPRVRGQFQERRAEWGKLVRVVDVELASLTLPDAGHATVLVDFSWTRDDEGTLRTTRVMQEWEAQEGPWVLVREKRVAGALGLFGEPMERVATGPRPNVQFATKVIP
jgi:hypothetical protein